ncbi:MAG: DUF871 domain-containing protein [Lachnospiraceae bacterium]|nr:DUF871 domain-containing protein [Lachnospiraceae bacterium]
MILGVSLYPEQEKLEDIDRYLEMASRYGFTKIFTSLFSVQGTREEVIAYFKNFTDIAHKYKMKVSGDANGQFFSRMGATETDLSVFKEMGIDIIRMDFSFNDERDAVLINNKEGIGIEMSTAFISVIEKALANGADPKNLSTCHNFYPERYTAPSLQAINEVNEYWKAKGIPVAIFISSQQKGTHGPWPVSDGLPTIEAHRTLPLEVQLKHCLALKNVDEILIGNAYASEEEFKAVAAVMEKAYIEIPVNKELGAYGAMLPHGNMKRIPFKIDVEEGLTELEREILFDYPNHSDVGDCLNYMLRSRWPRVVYRGRPIPPRVSDRTRYTRGDVVIVNDNLAHYRGEVQIVLKDMEADGQRNLLGRIREEEIMILDHMGAHDSFTFVE